MGRKPLQLAQTRGVHFFLGSESGEWSTFCIDIGLLGDGFFCEFEISLFRSVEELQVPVDFVFAFTLLFFFGLLYVELFNFDLFFLVHFHNSQSGCYINYI